MIRNFFKVSIRNILRYKIYSLLNIAGLAVGMACFLLIVFYVRFERSYDDFHKNKKRIYLLVRENQAADYSERRVNTGAPLAPLLLQNFPSIERAVRFTGFGGELVSYGEKQFLENRFFFADSDVFKVFSFPLLRGDPETALSEPFTALLTKRTAERYFGQENAIDKILHYSLSGRKYDFRITGILQDIPLNSHINPDFLASYKSLSTIAGEWFMTKHWDSPTWNYVLLKDGQSADALSAQLPEFTEKFVDRWGFISCSHSLLALKDVYFHSPGPAIGRWGNERNVFVLTLISTFILLIAAVNFMTLSTSRAGTRAKEIGLRKVVGAERAQLIRQFLGESLLFSFLALVLAIGLVELFLPGFSRHVDKNLSINYLKNSGYLIAMILTAIGTGLLSGAYPAFFLSSFRPVSVLRGKIQGEGRAVLIRKGLVVMQFAISITLIATVVLVSKQIHFLRNQELGFNKDQMITIPIRDRLVRERYELLKTRWLENPNILGVTASSQEPGVTSPNGIYLRGRDGNDFDLGIIYVDHDYLKTLEIALVKGRDFSRAITSDAASALLINEAAAERLGGQEVLGREVELFWKTEGKILRVFQTTVVGIVRNYHFQDLTTPLQPLLIKIQSQRLEYILARIRNENLKEALSHIERCWKDFQFGQPFEFSFLADDIQHVYRNFENLGSITRASTLLAIFIACLGLFGLASFTIEKRTREIGIRKVLGAGVPRLVGLMSKDFLALVALANILAWPAAYFAMGRFLQDFAYRTPLSPWIYAIAGLLALAIAWLTVGYQTIRAASANPADALRIE